MIMTGVSLVLTGTLTPNCTRSIRNATEISGAYTYESDDIRMAKVSKEFKFFDVHCIRNTVGDSGAM